MADKEARQRASARIANFHEVVAPAPDPFEIICTRLATGETLKEICRSWELPHGRILYWIMRDDWRYSVYTRSIAEGIRERIDRPTSKSEQII